MKTTILLFTLLLSTAGFSQSKMDQFIEQNGDLTWTAFEENNDNINIEKEDTTVKLVSINGITVDKDYKKITYVFIGDILSHCIVQFHEDQTYESLCEKYGKDVPSKSGFQWNSKSGYVQILYYDQYPDEVMITFNNISLNYNVRR